MEQHAIKLKWGSNCKWDLKSHYPSKRPKAFIGISVLKLWSKATRRYLHKTSIRTSMNETLPPWTSVLKRTPVTGNPREHRGTSWLRAMDIQRNTGTKKYWRHTCYCSHTASKQGHAEHQNFVPNKDDIRAKIAGSFPSTDFCPV